MSLWVVSPVKPQLSPGPMMTARRASAELLTPGPTGQFIAGSTSITTADGPSPMCGSSRWQGNFGQRLRLRAGVTCVKRSRQGARNPSAWKPRTLGDDPAWDGVGAPCVT